MAGRIGNLATVNGGKIVDTPEFSVEVLGPGYSTHREHMVVSYAKEGSIKVSVVYVPSNKSFIIFRFKTAEDLQHYWSKHVTWDWMLANKKYKNLADTCVKAYNMLFNT